MLLFMFQVPGRIIRYPGSEQLPKVLHSYVIEALNIGSHVFPLTMFKISVILLLLHKVGEMCLATWKKG